MSANTQRSGKDGEIVRTHSATAQIHQVMSGAISGSITRFLTQPFDVLKIRFQLQVEPLRQFRHIIPMLPNSAARTAAAGQASQSKYTSMFQACRVIFREEGVLAFWKGHNPGQIMSILYGVVQFWTYEQISLSIAQMPWMSHHLHTSHFLSGAMAGTLATFVTHPFDVIRTRFVAQDAGVGYKGTFSAFPIIWRKEGMAGFYRGFLPTFLQIGPLVGANFMFYQGFNEAFITYFDPSEHRLPAWFLLLTGTASGITSKALVYPLDFIKKRLQLRGFEEQRQTFGKNQGCSTIMGCIGLTLKHEGFTGFYKGMVPTLCKSGATTAFYFVVYDKAKELLDNWL